MITRLRVKNYKSLKDVDLRLRPLNVFVGPNGAGKSNILEVLELLSDLINMGAGALHSRGTFDQIVWNGEKNRVILIALEGVFDKKNKYLYEIQIAGSAEHYAVISEHFVFNPGETAIVLMEFNAESRELRLSDDAGKFVTAVGRTAGESALRTAGVLSPSAWLTKFAQSVSQWRRFQFSSERMRRLEAARRELQLTSAGDNLAVVLHTMQTEYLEQFERLTELLQVILPPLQSMFTPLTPDGRTALRIREKDLSVPVSLASLSDGTLHALAVMTALNVPQPPDLMSFEEPENYVHPRVLQVLAEEFKGASDPSQILVTTHSPYFLEYFSMDDIVVVDRTNGVTKTNRLPQKGALRNALEELGPASAWYTGSIGGVP